MREQLVAHVHGELDIEFRRDFNAPRLLVWKALTEAELIKTWLWADHIPMTTCEMDVRVSGSYRWVWTRPDGTEMGMGGRFVEISAPERLVTTELFDDDWTGGETLVTQCLTELSSSLTQLRILVRYANTKARDRAFASPMAEGMEQAYGRLERTVLET